jgi:hypothetical protein
MKYPFLYPRNRFTGTHRTNALHKLISWAKDKGIINISITAKIDTDPTRKDKCYMEFKSIDPINFGSLDVENRKLVLKSDVETKEHSLKNLLWTYDRFEILGFNLIKTKYMKNPGVIIYVKPKDENDKTNYGFHYENVDVTINRFYKGLYKVLDWFDRNILDRILFLPTYTEWDVVEYDMPGWNKAFGKQYLDELKTQLKKDKMLYTFRVLQIKEKWGSFQFYCAGATKEVYDIIHKYEGLSYHTCYDCGEPATKYTTGWVLPLCDKCFEEHEKYKKEHKLI